MVRVVGQANAAGLSSIEGSFSSFLTSLVMPGNGRLWQRVSSLLTAGHFYVNLATCY